MSSFIYYKYKRNRPIASVIKDFVNKKSRKVGDSRKEIQKRFCKSGEVYDSFCVSYNDVEKKTDDDKYKKCNFGEKCIYNVIGLNYNKIYEINCPCGYNSEGQGYCPHYHEYSKDDWDEYRTILKKNYDSWLHFVFCKCLSKSVFCISNSWW